MSQVVLVFSAEHLRAPFFAAMAALKFGADLSHVICSPTAAGAIKAYSPDLIVHPILREESTPERVKPELESLLTRLHVLIIGPGLGREPYMESYAKLALSLARSRGMFVVLDADALWMIGKDLSVIKGYRRAVVTPNVVEFKRLSEQAGIDPEAPSTKKAGLVSRALGGVTVLEKGLKDIICIDTTGEAASLKESKLEGADEEKEKMRETIEVDVEGGLKRCGGQGDILSGSVGTFLAWGKCYEDGAFGLTSDQFGKITASRMPFLAAVGGSIVTRTASRLAFAKEGRGVVTQDMIPEIGRAFAELLIRPNNKLNHALNQCRYHEEKQETQLRSDRRHMGRVQGLLHGGSAKPFFPPSFSPLPLALSSTADDSLDDLVTGPQRIRETTVQYFQRLYRRSTRPPQSKPWTETASVHGIAQRVDAEPFQWPQTLTVSDLRQLVKSGNRRPAPGPDGWEKWWLAHLSDAGLSPVLQLLNYILTRSRIPACIKSVTLTTIHKRGPNTNLSNFRGITCSNLLANLPFAWLNKKLLPYLTTYGIVPSSQVATQPGVQHRDLLSFLAQLQMWAKREKVPLFAIQRDQKKGFDMLEPEGFYDALAAYHLPSSIALLDASAQREVPYQVKTVYGLTETFVVDGVTKQGGSLSPLKCTITTSLLSHWLSDVSSSLQRPLLVTSHQSRAGKPHVPSDSAAVPLSMVEAMDDSIIWDVDWSALIHKARLADRFQSTYGWETAWRKSAVYAFNGDFDPPNQDVIQVPSVPPSDPSSPVTIWNDVPVYRDHIRFLKVPVNRPDLQFLHMRDIVHNFHLPFSRRPLPFTALLRIISQRLVSKLRPCLQLQPIRPSDAVKLDHLIAAKVHQYFGFPFAFSTALFHHPVASHGFGFPSLAVLNDAACLTGLRRDLCHPVALFRDMAAVTLNDWTCLLNACHSPLEYPLAPRSSTRYLSRMPATWIYANDCLHKHNLRLQPTDLSYLLSSHLSLVHYTNVLDTYRSFPSAPPFPPLSRNLLSRMLRRGFTTIAHLGTVSFSPDYYTPLFRAATPPTVRDAPRSSSLSRDWHSFMSWFTYTFRSITTTSPAGPDLLLPPIVHQEAAEHLLLSMSSSPPYLTHHNLPDRVYASDASSIPPAPPTILPTVPFTRPPSSLTCSVIGPDSGFLASMATLRYIASTSHAEVAGCLSAVLRAQHQSGGTIYTDYLPVVNWLSSQSAAPSAYHRWLQDITQRSPDTGVLHVKAHTTSSSLPARLNRAADHAALHCHSLYNPPPSFPAPTFHLQPYCFFAPGRGFFEGNLPQYLQKQQAAAFNTSKAVWSTHLTSPNLYDSTPPPLFPYQRSPYAYAAIIQLYARSAQLDSRDLLTSRLDAGCTPWCRYGCHVLESPHHLFTHCHAFDTLRQSAVHDLLSSVDTALDDSVPPPAQRTLIGLTRSLFSDDASWPTGQTRYYMGFLPPIDHLHLPQSLHTRISHLWHTASIHLAGRVWAKARQKAFESRMSKPPQPPYRVPEIVRSLFHL
ncbi:hypothetical protein D9615_007407 [Tricholomella constricta]|uniref:ATP-dependent (S)-NAD(P)H-hydrate dehydratase n=1 Tax=Tricholomella constricta TaxID=117010 RepID=A0A8H5GYH1_9AGAR|nr:hypothetical protein D9615_007407 [Tricholomella constricta]